MLKRISLHNRFRLLFLGAVIASVVVSSVLSLNLWGRGVQDATAMNLLAFAQEYELEIQNNPSAAAPQREFTKIYRSWEAVPADIKALFPLEAQQDFELMSDGFDMFEEATEETELTFFLPYPITSPNEGKIYVYSKFKPHPSVYANDGMLFATIELVALFNFVLILFIAFLIERRLLQPINALITLAERVKTRRVSGKLPEILKNSEIGSIAKPIQDSIDVMRDYHLREKQFLETASHELRTSIAVTRSALDIIEMRMSRGDSNLGSSLSQIKSSNKDMTAITETLLHLAKAPDHKSKKQVVDLSKLMEELITEHNYLLHESCTVTTDFADNCAATVEPIYCRIAIANLLRNAFENTDEGNIEVFVDKSFVKIVNGRNNQSATRQSMQENEPKKRHYGYGLGLEIVNRFAEKDGWDFTISDANDVFIVTIRFS